MMRKLTIMFSTIALAVGLIAAFSVLSAADFPEPYPFRPSCNATYQSNDGSPLSVPLAPLQESYDPDDLQKYCYINSTLLYIQQDLKFGYYTDPWGNPIDVRPSLTYADLFVNQIGFLHPDDKSVGHPLDPIILKYRYYTPEWEIPAIWQPYFEGATQRCFSDTNNFIAFLGNDDSEGFSDADFNTADYILIESEKSCYSWTQFSHIANDFVNYAGTSFSHNRKSIGAVDFEMANIYIDLSSIELCTDAGCTKVMP